MNVVLSFASFGGNRCRIVGNSGDSRSNHCGDQGSSAVHGIHQVCHFATIANSSACALAAESGRNSGLIWRAGGVSSRDDRNGLSGLLAGAIAVMSNGLLPAKTVLIISTSQPFGPASDECHVWAMMMTPTASPMPTSIWWVQVLTGTPPSPKLLHGSTGVSSTAL